MPLSQSPVSDTDLFDSAPDDFEWPKCPETDRVLRGHVDSFLNRHCFASNLSKRMYKETGTRFFDWVDHLVLPPSHAPIPVLESLGFTREHNVNTSKNVRAYHHPHASFPRILIDPDSMLSSVAIAVESIDDFKMVWNTNNHADKEDKCFNDPFRSLSVNEGTNRFVVIERHGYRGYIPPHTTTEKDLLVQAKDQWTHRKRDSYSKEEAEDVMQKTLECAQKIASSIGPARAADLVLAIERDKWLEKNKCGRWQKDRLDRLGLGWGAIRDHHTFREDRENFPMLVRIFLALGFKKREKFSPPGDDFWAAQVMEHPMTGDVLFLDVDFFPEDEGIDFADNPLPDRKKFSTVGRWCALHDSSIRGAGMHHLECQFDFEKMKKDLLSAGISCHDFSNLPHLKQTFTQGEQWPVEERRLEEARRIGAISADTYTTIKNDGWSIGSHLEDLERNDGFKGFNQKGIGVILHDVDPERFAIRTNVQSIVH